MIENAWDVVLDEVVKIVNFITSRPLSSATFRTLFDEMGNCYTMLLT